MKIGIALGSGGAKGFAHIPYLQALDELGVNVDCISGTSMGAFLGAFYAGGMPAKEIHELAVNFGLSDMPKVITPAMFSKFGLVKGKKIEDFLTKNLPVLRFEDLKIPLKISATDYWNQKEYVFDSGDIVPAIRASISIPGVFQPYQYQGNLYIDGGMVNSVPFDLLTEADFKIAIDVMEDYDNEDKSIPGLIDVIIGSYFVMKKTIMDYRKNGSSVDIYRSPDLSKYHVLAFHKSEKVIKAVVDDVEEFKEEVTQLLL